MYSFMSPAVSFSFWALAKCSLFRLLTVPSNSVYFFDQMRFSTSTLTKRPNRRYKERSNHKPRCKQLRSRALSSFSGIIVVMVTREILLWCHVTRYIVFIRIIGICVIMKVITTTYYQLRRIIFVIWYHNDAFWFVIVMKS